MPKDFFADTSSSLRFKFYFDPKSEIESAIIQGEIQKTVMTQASKLFPVLLQKRSMARIGDFKANKFMDEMSRLISGYFEVPIDSVIRKYSSVDSVSLFRQDAKADSSSGSNFMSNIVKFESEQLVGKELTNPGLTRTVGGWAIMFLLFTITGASTSLFEEKSEGTLKRILCMPVNRTQILWSKYLYTMLLGIIQLLVLFLFAWAFYKVDIFSNFFNLMVMIIVSSGAAVAFGMVITSFSTSIAQASGFSTLIILIMSALGGSWFPITFFPEWLQNIARGTITYWSVEGFLQVLWRQASFTAIIPNVVVLLMIALIVNFYSIVRFKKGKVF
jgi:ABC-2 type transport system permease protein